MWMSAAALMLLHAVPAMAQSISAQPQAVDYDAMLGWLATSRIDGDAFVRSRGAIAVNQAAGDANLQANLRAIAIGERADADIVSLQHPQNQRLDAPRHAEVSLGGRALQGAGGLVSINQASGSGNAELNSVAVVLAQQGIRETGDDFLSLSGVASARRVHAVSEPGARTTQTRKVGVEASALQGFEGVLQLNQVAGMGNATENQLRISVQGP